MLSTFNKPSGRSILHRSLPFLTVLAAALAVGCAQAQVPPAPVGATAAAKPPKAKRSHSVSGSPLDTLRSTHLWTKTAPPQDFVRDSRPDPAALDYAPLTGADPARPKPRDAANVLALQAELERSRAVNEGKGRAVGGVARKAPRRAAAAN